MSNNQNEVKTLAWHLEQAANEPDLDAIERKLIRMGYHGYRGYNASVPNAIAIFGRVPVKPAQA